MDNWASSAIAQGVRAKGNYAERHTYIGDTLEVGECIKMYARNYSLGSWHKSLDKAPWIAKEIPPKDERLFSCRTAINN